MDSSVDLLDNYDIVPVAALIAGAVVVCGVEQPFAVDDELVLVSSSGDKSSGDIGAISFFVSQLFCICCPAVEISGDKDILSRASLVGEGHAFAAGLSELEAVVVAAFWTVLAAGLASTRLRGGVELFADSGAESVKFERCVLFRHSGSPVLVGMARQARQGEIP